MPGIDWLKHPAMKHVEVAHRLGVSRSLFAKKLYNVQHKRFSAEELVKLETIRNEIINELSK